MSKKVVNLNYIKDFVVILLLLRIAVIYPFNKIEIINNVYLLFSKGISMIVLIKYMYNIIKKRRMSKFGVLVVLFYFWELIVTIFMGRTGIRRVFMAAYPVICLCFYLEMEMSKRKEEVLYNISSLFSILCVFNIIFQILMPTLFGRNQYLLGGRNQFALLYIISFGLTRYIYAGKRSLICYFSYLLSIYIAGSVTSTMAFVFLGLIEIIPIIKKWIGKIDYKLIFGVTILISVLISVFNIVKYFDRFIIDVLGRDLSLSYRTYIWDNVVNEISKSPIIGCGVQNTINSFHIYVKFLNAATIDRYYSAHNQILQTAYEVGIVGVLMLLIIVIYVYNYSRNNSLINVLKNCSIGVAIIYICEAPGIDTLLIILALIFCHTKYVSNNDAYSEIKLRE